MRWCGGRRVALSPPHDLTTSPPILHPLDGPDAEQVERLLEDAADQIDQQQPAVLQLGRLGLKHLATTPHPPALYHPEVLDGVAEIATEVADRTARRLATQGYLVGWSAGAAVAAALQILEREPDAYVVAIGCDTGVRYLSEPHRWEPR